MSMVKVKAPIHKNRQTTMARIQGLYTSDSFWKNINLTSKQYNRIELRDKEILHFPILGPHGSWQNYTFEDIKNSSAWVPANEGQQFGPSWTTHWFHVKYTIPAGNQGKELHMRWASGCEAMVYDKDGNVLQGISPGFREEFPLSSGDWEETADKTVEYYIEMACNGMFGVGEGSDIAPPNPNRYFTLSYVDVAIFNRQIWNLLIDFEMLYGMSDQMGDTHVGYQAMFVANEMVNIMQVENNVDKARALASEFFNEAPGAKAHTLYAMGYCHIDSAWLWPYDETVRKCARSFSAQVGLMDEYKDIGYKFVCSSAQQYKWVEEYYPSLFARIKEKVTDGQFVPVGGTWIEMDGNLPSGEAFMRQYYFGQKYFAEKFGVTCSEFWLPDTFGYSAQIPQMLAHVEITRFLTQKMSWSLVNKFPNHNFWWEGIDGSRVLVHFPPGNSYNMSGLVHEVLSSQNNSLDKGRVNSGAFIYGYGDGGGGPTRQMIERIKRVQNVDGMPKVKFSESNEFFDELVKDSDNFYTWVGELYLELHNGTYTSQARIKSYNRKSEFLFREIELLLSMAYVTGKVPEGTLIQDIAIVDDAWRDFLLNQFHDVLPGSCIEFAAQDAWGLYEKLFTNLMAIRVRYNAAILGSGTNQAIFNSLPWPVKGVMFMNPDAPQIPPTGPNTQVVTLDANEFENQVEGRFRVPNTFTAALVNLQPSGYTSFSPQAPSQNVSFLPASLPSFGTYSNGQLTVEVSLENNRPIEKLYFDGANRIEAFNDFAKIGIEPGMFYIYDDIPMFWDAWDIMDYHLETRRMFAEDFGVPENLGGGPIVGCYKWSASFGNNGSSLVRYTILRADSPMIEYYTIVDWKEEHKLLKVEWPVDVLARDATFEIQYGHLKRATHMNTSWDMAKYEVCGHKWMDISQADKGVTFITDSKYGWHVRGNHVQLSLLKSPKNPDANADMQKHYIYYAVLPHKGTFQESEVIPRAYELNVFGSNNIPLIPGPATGLPANFVVSSNPAVVVEAVKVSKPKVNEGVDPTLNTLCVRMYESHGGYSDSEISFGFNVAEIFETNGLELKREAVSPPAEGNKLNVRLKPFQIRSFVVTFTR